MQSAIAVISDIHSNFEALTAVLDDVRSQEVSQIVCLGDIVGYASSVQSCIPAVRELGCPVLMGNHDEAACLPAPVWSHDVIGISMPETGGHVQITTNQPAVGRLGCAFR